MVVDVGIGGEATTVLVDVTVRVGVTVRVAPIVLVGVMVRVGQTSGVTVTVGVVVRVAVIVSVGEMVGVALLVAVGVRVAVTLRVAVTVFVGEMVLAGVMVRVTDRVGMILGVGTRVGVRGITDDATPATPTDAGIAPAAGSIPRCPEAFATDVWPSGIHMTAQTSSMTDTENHLRMQITIDHAVVSPTTGLKALASSTVDPLDVRDHAGPGKDRSGLNRTALTVPDLFGPPLHDLIEKRKRSKEPMK